LTSNESTEVNPDKVIAVIAPSPVRRAISVAMTFGLGGLLIYVTMAAPPAEILWQVFLLGIGLGALILAEKMRRATARRLILRIDGISDDLGRDLCRMSDVVGVDRGTFAFKPANGFLLRMKSRQAPGWAPGLWWRRGKFIGVGGAIPGQSGKVMAEAIAQIIAIGARD